MTFNDKKKNLLYFISVIKAIFSSNVSFISVISAELWPFCVYYFNVYGKSGPGHRMQPSKSLGHLMLLMCEKVMNVN